MRVRALLTTSALLLLAAVSAADPATCKTIWILRLPCSKPVSALVNQVKAWSTRQCFDSKEQCKYVITKEYPGYIEINRTSLSTRKTTVISLEFNPPASPVLCKVKALTKTSTRDTGANDYCLLHNLVSESGLIRAEGFKEICSEGMCPSKVSAKCNSE